MNKQTLFQKELKSSRLYYLLIIVICFFVYGNSLNHQYALDDYTVFLKNNHVQNGIDGIGKILSTNLLNGMNGFNDGLYRPTSPISFALEKSLYDHDPFWMHFWNVIIYGLSVILLLMVLQKLFSTIKTQLLFCIALLFLVHPLHTEVVANIKGRDELFAFLGFIASVLYSIKYFEIKKFSSLILSFVLFTFSLFSKESAIVFFVFAPTLLWFKFGVEYKKEWIKLLSSYVLSTILFLGIRSYVLSNMLGEVDQGIFSLLNNPIAATNDFSLRWGSAFALQPLFIAKLIFPFPLIHDYSYSAIELSELISIESITGILLLLTFGICALVGVFKRKLLAILSTLYLVSISLVSQLLFPIGTHFAERLLFLSVLPFVMLLIPLFKFLIKKYKSLNQPLLVVCYCLIAFWAYKSFERSKDWENNFSLYSADIRKDSKSARVNYNYGSELSQQADMVTNQNKKIKLLNTSINHLSKAIKIYPDYKDAYNNLGLAYKKGKNYNRAIETFKTAISRDPLYSKSYYNLATTYFEIKKYNECITFMNQYLGLKPNSFNAFYIMGQAAGFMNDFNAAAQYLTQALNINPNNVEALNFLAMAYGMNGDLSNSQSILLKALQLDPNNIQVLTNLSINYYQQQKFKEEREILNRILQLDPNNQNARNRLN